MIHSKTLVREILQKYPQVERVFEEFEIDCSKISEKSIYEAAHEFHIPYQVLLNNIAKACGEEIEWAALETDGTKSKNSFGVSTNLRTGDIPGVKKVLGVHSGKGGVGKTFISVQLALDLARRGCRVGLVDLDIDCPNILKVMKIEGRLFTGKNRKIVPFEKYGVKVVSMGAALERENQALLWRGPIIAKAVEQLLYDTDWGELDVLIADLPPGTGDSPVTLINLLKLAGMLVVATPQEAALIDALKSVDMCEKMGVPVLGVLENMTGEVFGRAQGAAKFQQFKKDIVYLGEIELQAKYNRAEKPGELHDAAFSAVMDKVYQQLFKD